MIGTLNSHVPSTRSSVPLSAIRRPAQVLEMLNTVVDATTPPPQRFSSEEQLLQPLPEVYDKVQRTATQPTQPRRRAAMRGNTAQPRRDRRSGREAVGTTGANEERRCTHGYD